MRRRKVWLKRRPRERRSLRKSSILKKEHLDERRIILFFSTFFSNSLMFHGSLR
jgi:hypothetical protein